jgi:integrase
LYTIKSSSCYANQLKAIKVFFRDFLGQEELVKSFKFPPRTYRYLIVPLKDQLRGFYNGFVSDFERSLFLMYATSGRRVSEIISLHRDDVDLDSRMLLPTTVDNRTKKTGISFFNEKLRCF